MNMKAMMKIVLSAFILMAAQSCAQAGNKEQATGKKTVAATKKPAKETRVQMETSLGTVTIKLYNETPLHRDNFIKLAKDGFYADLLFHRVIPNFMIQGGDPDSKDAKPGQALGIGNVGYTIPAEFVFPMYYHKKGALAAARTGDGVNPKKESSGSQFYIVTGTVLTDAQLDNMENSKRSGLEQALFQQKVNENTALINKYRAENNQDALMALQNKFITEVQAEAALQAPFTFTDEQRQAYKTVGGTPFLDNDYTVFGEIVEGMDVVDKIAAVKTAPGDRPVEDVKIISVKVLE
jgi:peptidylprolyl isomerase